MYIYCSTILNVTNLHAFYTNQLFVNFISVQKKSENYEMRTNANQKGQEVEQTTKDCVYLSKIQKSSVNSKFTS